MLYCLGLRDADYTLQIYCNLLTRFAFLVNLPAEELTPTKLDNDDPGQQLLICAQIDGLPIGRRPSRPIATQPGGPLTNQSPLAPRRDTMGIITVPERRGPPLQPHQTLLL